MKSMLEIACSIPGGGINGVGGDKVPTGTPGLGVRVVDSVMLGARLVVTKLSGTPGVGVGVWQPNRLNLKATEL